MVTLPFDFSTVLASSWHNTTIPLRLNNVRGYDHLFVSNRALCFGFVRPENSGQIFTNSESVHDLHVC